MAQHDSAWMTTATTGTGTLTLGAAVPGYQSFFAAGVTNGETVSYTIADGLNFEYGHGTYTTAGTTLARTTILGGTNGAGTPTALSGTATVMLTTLAEDLVVQGGIGVGTFLPTTTFAVQTTGFSYTLVSQATVLTPAGTLATGTITMPTTASGITRVRVTSTQTVTALTVSANSGQYVSGMPTTLPAGWALEAALNPANSTWYVG